MVVQPEIAALLEVVSVQEQVLHQLEVAHLEAVMLLEPEADLERRKYRLALQPEAAPARDIELALHHPEEDMTRDEIHQNIEVVQVVPHERLPLVTDI